ncbi:cation acetate symporter [soil metagenome]
MANRPAGAFRSLTTLFPAAFLIGLVVLALVGNFGLPDAALGTTLSGAILVTFAAIGISARTMQSSEFYVAGNAVPPGSSGMASAAAFLSAGGFLGLAGAAFTNLESGIAITLGWSFGFVLLAVLFAPYMRKSGARGVADFLGIRFGGRMVRLVALCIVVAVLMPALAATMATAASVMTALLHLPPAGARIAVIALILSATLLGGMRGLTLTAVAQYIVLAFAFVIPAALVSALEYSVPIPPLVYGLALQDALALANNAVLAAAPPASFLPMVPRGAVGLGVTVLVLAAGVAALPHVLMHSTTSRRVAGARRAAGWALACVLVVALTAPAYTTFAKLAVFRDLVGASIDALPDWVFAFGRRGLVMICGADASSAEAVAQACSAQHGAGAPLAAGDIAVGGDVIVLAWAVIVGLHYVVTALIATGALAAMLAAANALAFAIAEALGHDLYGNLLDVKASAGRRLIVTRLFLVLVVLAGAWLAAGDADMMFALALATVSLSAGGLFPVLFLAIWWKRANAAGAAAGMAAGLATTAAIVIAARYPGAARFDLGLDTLSAAMIGAPIGFLATVAVSLATIPPTPAQDAIVDTIRRPRGGSFVEGAEN